MTRMTRPDCAVMCNLINTHTHNTCGVQPRLQALLSICVTFLRVFCQLPLIFLINTIYCCAQKGGTKLFFRRDSVQQINAVGMLSSTRGRDVSLPELFVSTAVVATRPRRSTYHGCTHRTSRQVNIMVVHEQLGLDHVRCF